jgi:hypothetical protein
MRPNTEAEAYRVQDAVPRHMAEVTQEQPMQLSSHANPEKALSRPLPVKTEPRAATPIWQPQPGSLTREELRKIFTDLTG